ncbi:MAG: pyrimidine 5'-nucleotidase [Mariprofundaceae bacterium]
MPFDLAVIDLDNTLYAANNGVFARMDRRMTTFVANELGLAESLANDLRLRYWKQYGTTLRGMMLHHGMKPEPFLEYVHDIDVHELLEQDDDLDAALERLPGKKVVHTNGTKEHAGRVLESLGIHNHFNAIYDIRFNDYIPKPCQQTLINLIRSEESSPPRTLVVDDMANNLQAAKEAGCKTVRITHEQGGSWDFHIPKFHHLPDALGVV